mmetsp:Transcript_875/g.2255  ORF Transcript_875/g.2255 Transcript_875/m.2255 type:complete len:207 (+) Transcript_875:240-860(+)
MVRSTGDNPNAVQRARLYIRRANERERVGAWGMPRARLTSGLDRGRLGLYNIQQDAGSACCGTGDRPLSIRQFGLQRSPPLVCAVRSLRASLQSGATGTRRLKGEHARTGRLEWSSSARALCESSCGGYVAAGHKLCVQLGSVAAAPRPSAAPPPCRHLAIPCPVSCRTTAGRRLVGGWRSHAGLGAWSVLSIGHASMIASLMIAA